MLLGKARQIVVSRLLLDRAVSADPPAGIDFAAAFSQPRLAAFASIYATQSERFAADCLKLHHGEFTSNGVSHSFGSPSNVRWHGALDGAEYVRWQHDLAYFAFAPALITTDPEQGIPTLVSLIRALEAQLVADATELRRFHWSPIAVASRTMGLASAMALVPPGTVQFGRDAVNAVGAHMWRCWRILRLTVERYLGFNHAATTEAGLLIASLLIGREDSAAASLAKFVATIERSILRDGMWAERSPTYHLHMLVLVDGVKSMLETADPSRLQLERLSQRMRAALDAVVHPDGDVAVFNDAAIGDAPTPAALGWVPHQIPALVVLPEAGYARLSRGNTVAIMDAGPMGPDPVLAHGHADFLSVEVSIDGKRLIVDPGVASMSDDQKRHWSRSASSHNGPTVSGCEPAEFLSAWKVGRRGTAYFDEITESTKGSIAVAGECTGYSPWGITVRRKITLERDGTLCIEDEWVGPSDRDFRVAFLIPEWWIIARKNASSIDVSDSDGRQLEMIFEGGKVARISSSHWFLKGPLSQRPATMIEIHPTSRDLLTTISRVV
ncbi:MAG: heparinase II/III-family protein [Mycolicibacterium rufum]|nr:heparinase II/III-family protein [Mycolicibacterium rufum]